MTKYAERNKQRGLSDQVISWIIAVVLSAFSGAAGVFAAYVNMNEEVAVMNTKLEFIMRDVSEIKADLKKKADKP